MDSFIDLGLPKALTKALTRMKFTTPTPIQAKAIPPALEGKDILGSAQTGTGKTAAFAIPLLTKLINEPRSAALIMTPTRELATQVMGALHEMGGNHPTIKTALIIGGDSMPKQLQALRARPRLIVGTPGRINDHLARGSMMLAKTNFLVLDEMDRMLDMGFSVQIEKIIKFLPKIRQTLLFSATLPHNILKLSEKYLHQPVRVSVGSTTKPIAKIQQELIHLKPSEKYQTLSKELEKREGSIIIFVKTKRGAQRLADRLYRQKHKADAVHGDLQQRKRERVINAFRERKHRILVATDIVARGLDIDHIKHVINYDLPQCPEDYIHRIGRTARNGAEGASVCFISPEDTIKWKAIDRLMNASKQEHGGRKNNRSNQAKKGKRPSKNGKSFYGKRRHQGGKHKKANNTTKAHAKK